MFIPEFDKMPNPVFSRSTLALCFVATSMASATPLQDDIAIEASFTPRKIEVRGAPSKALDDELVKLFSENRFNPERYRQAEALIERGAFVTEAAVYATAFATDAPDFRSLQTLYLNGGFDKKLFSGPWIGGNSTCDFLLAALTVNRGEAHPTRHAAVIEAAEQNARFLIDKAFPRRCVSSSSYMNLVVESPPRPRVLKLLIAAGQVNAQEEMKRLTSRGGLFDAYALNPFPPSRQAGVSALISAGAGVTSGALEGLAYEAAKGAGAGRAEVPDAFGRALETLLPGVADKLGEGQRLLDWLARDQKIRVENGRQAEARFIGRMQQEAKVVLDRAVGGDFAGKQAQKAVLADLDGELSRGREGDRRRIAFYLSRGVQPEAGQLYALVRFGMADLAMPIIEKMPEQLDLRQLADAAVYGGDTKALDWALDQTSLKAAGLEAPVLHLIRQGDTVRAARLVNKGVDPTAVMKLAFEQLKDAELDRAAEACGDTGRRMLTQHRHDLQVQAERQAKADAERDRAEAAQSAKLRAQYARPKRVGDKVCRDGRVLGISRYTISAFVERVSGQRIQLRIAPGMSLPNMQPGQIIWADHTDWRGC